MKCCGNCNHSTLSLIIGSKLQCYLTDELVEVGDNCGMWDGVD